MDNADARIEKLLDAVDFLSRDHVADLSVLAPVCSSCGENYPCLSVRVARNAQYFGVLHFGEPKIRTVEGSSYLPNALRHIDEWISTSGDYSVEMVEVIDELHRLVIAEGVECRGAASADGLLELQVRARSIGGSSIPLWSIASDVDEMFLRINVAHTTESGRAFLAAILTDAFSPLDADQLVSWWCTLETSRTRTITTPLPSDSDTAVSMMTQLINATYTVAGRIRELMMGGL